MNTDTLRLLTHSLWGARRPPQNLCTDIISASPPRSKPAGATRPSGRLACFLHGPSGTMQNSGFGSESHQGGRYQRVTLAVLPGHRASTKMGTMIRPTTMMLPAALWALLALPILCTTEVLAHHCDCESETACGQDDSCADDTCHTMVVRGRQHLHRDGQVSHPDLPKTTDPCLAGFSTRPRPTLARDASPPLPLISLPFAESDVPLLL